MPKRWFTSFAIVVSAAVVVYVGCSSKGTSFAPPPPTQAPHTAPPTTPAPQAASTRVPLVAGTSLPIPAIGGFAGSFVAASNNAPAGTMVTLTSYMSVPSSAPVPQAVIRMAARLARAHPLSATPSAIFWVSQKYSAAAAFQGFPITTWTMPESDAGSGPLALETIDGTTNTLLDTEFDTSISGNTVTFPGSSSTFSVTVGHTYWWELITGKPLPSPSPTISPTVSPSPSTLKITSGTPPSGWVGIVYGQLMYHPPYCTCRCKEPGCRRGGYYSFSGPMLTASGGTPPYSWSWAAAAGSSLPPGLSLTSLPASVASNADGITGTPAAVGMYRVVISVSDAGSPAQHMSAAYAIVIAPGIPSPAPAAVQEYKVSVTASPDDITVGPDGALWFTENGPTNVAGRITTSGAITEFAGTPGAFAGARGIVAGPDGNLWFVENGRGAVAKLTPSGHITEYVTPTAGTDPTRITRGPDGNLWFTMTVANLIGRITMAGVITEYSVPTPGSWPWDSKTGRNGALWFTEQASGQIGRITTAGVITNEYSAPGATALVSGPDGNLWFAPARSGNAYGIGRMTTSGALTFFCCTPNNVLNTGMVVGPDGNIWFTEHDQALIGRVTMSGKITAYSGATLGAGPVNISPGPSGDPHLWFTEFQGNSIGKIHI